MPKRNRKSEENIEILSGEKELRISKKSKSIIAVNVDEVERLESPETYKKTDKHFYRVIKLKNGLKALLISDLTKDANKNIITSRDVEGTASCSLCVGSGSSLDPRNLQGLAHLVEHMVHLGTKKYPGENEFFSFISKHGGSTNASTDIDYTTYFFDIEARYLDQALERFSDMFVEPLMLKETIQRERESVDSEFLSNFFYKEFRQFHFLLSLGRSNHPSSLFTFGNLTTLKNSVDDDDLYRKAHEFRKRYYSAGRMYFCVYASMDLDELQNLVDKHFSNVPQNSLRPRIYSDQSHNYAFSAKFYKKVFFVKAIENMSNISITWCLPSMLKNYKCKVDGYMAYIIGHAAEGGIKNYLKKKLWATELTANEHMDDSLLSNSLYTLFIINIELTGLGFKHLDEVLKATFGYIRFLQRTGPNLGIFKDLQSIAKTQYEHRSNGCLKYYIEQMAENLKTYPLNHVLQGDLLYFEYNPEAIKIVIDHLNTSKFNITITSSELYDKNVDYDLKEKMMGIEYCERDMPEKWSILHKNARSNADFFLPKLSQFTMNNCKFCRMRLYDLPVIMESDVCVLKYEREIRKHAIYEFSLISHIASSHKSMVLMELYTYLLNLLHEALLTELGLKFWNYAKSYRIDFIVHSSDEEAVIKFIKVLKNLPKNITEEQFCVCVQEMDKCYDNQIIHPDSLETDLSSCLLDAGHVLLFDKKHALQTLTLKDLQKFHRQFLKRIYIDSAMFGILTKRSAKNIIKKILQIFECDSTSYNNHVQNFAVQIPVGKSYLRCQNFNQQDENTITKNYYQIGKYSSKLNVLLQLLVKIGDCEIQYKLRTAEQLGYVIYIERSYNHGILGYSIKIKSQESKFSAEYIDERIENFRKDLVSIIKNMSNEDFECYKCSYVKDTSVKEVTKADLLEFYEKNIKENDRKLCIQIIGNSNTDNHKNNNSVNAKHLDLENLIFVDFNKPKSGIRLIKNLAEFKNKF